MSSFDPELDRQIDEYVARLVADAPPFTETQRVRLRTVLAPAAQQLIEHDAAA